MTTITVRLAAAVAAVALAIAGTSCAPATGSAGPSADSQSSPSAVSRTVDTAFGAVTIPTAPQRAIALEGGVGPLLDAGVTPVATADGDYADSFLPAEYEQVKDLPLILGPDGWDYEKIASLSPDLMIGFVRGGSDGNLSEDAKQEWAKLNAIAPTVLIKATGSAETKEATLEMSTALGDGADAEAAKAAYQAKAAQIKSDYADVLSEAVFAPVDYYEEVYVYSPISWPGATVTDAGGTLTEVSADERDSNATFLSVEQIGRIDDATVVLTDETVEGKPGEGAAALAKQPTYQALPAVKSGDAYGLRYFFADRYQTGLESLNSFQATLQQLR